MKYKAGDRVTIRPDLEMEYSYSMEDSGKRIRIVKEMVRYGMKEATIEREVLGFYRLKEIGWLWADEMFLSEKDDLDESPFDLQNLMEVNV